MRFKRVVNVVCMLTLLIIADNAMPSGKLPDITVYAFKDATGSVWNSVTGKSEHLLSYKVTVNNNTEEAIVPGKGNKMCFYLDDDKGHKLAGRSAQVELLAPYKPGESRDGLILFSSTDPELLKLSYVKLYFGTQCPANSSPE